MTDIRGKVAFVTGAGSGIGRAIAEELVVEGAGGVAVVDIIEENAKAVSDAISAQGVPAVPILCDVSDRAAVARAKREANDALGPVGLLFANAGATSFEPLTDMSEDDVDWIIQVNLMGVTNCLMAFLPDMIAAGDGHAFATASMAGMLPSWIPYHAPYSAAKAGIMGMMLNLGYELGRQGIGSTVLCPGGTATGMKENNSKYRPQRFGGPFEGEVNVPPDVLETFANVGLKFRPAQDVAQMVLLAIKENRPIVVTDPNDRQTFIDTYVDAVLKAFDEVDAFEESLAARPGA